MPTPCPNGRPTKQAAAAITPASPTSIPITISGRLTAGAGARISSASATMAPPPNATVPSKKSTSNRRLNPAKTLAPSFMPGQRRENVAAYRIDKCKHDNAQEHGNPAGRRDGAFPLNQFECDQEHPDSHDDV